ncbi:MULTISPECIES: DUF5133 domain-containing protein [unclassified Streptomyces]|uniref:DUF5133 domain-containing protein n=1 Tax=unclassified Streptomyces TaxID=2593676 RepID=UPI003D7185D9
MLMPHPAVLRRLVDEYEALTASDEKADRRTEADIRAQDLAYTLCVSTGTRDVRHALQTAHRWLSHHGSAPTAGPAGADPRAYA